MRVMGGAAPAMSDRVADATPTPSAERPPLPQTHATMVVWRSEDPLGCLRTSLISQPSNYSSPHPVRPRVQVQISPPPPSRLNPSRRGDLDHFLLLPTNSRRRIRSKCRSAVCHLHFSNLIVDQFAAPWVSFWFATESPHDMLDDTIIANTSHSDMRRIRRRRRRCPWQRNPETDPETETIYPETKPQSTTRRWWSIQHRRWSRLSFSNSLVAVFVVLYFVGIGATTNAVHAMTTAIPVTPNFRFDGTHSDMAQQYYHRWLAGDIVPQLSSYTKTGLPDEVEDELYRLGLAWYDLPGLLQHALLWDMGFARSLEGAITRVYTRCGRSMAQIFVARKAYERIGCTPKACSVSSGEFFYQHKWCDGDQATRISLCAADYVESMTHSGMWADGADDDFIPDVHLVRHAWVDHSDSYLMYALHTAPQGADSVAYNFCPVRPSPVIPCASYEKMVDKDKWCVPERGVIVKPWLSNFADARKPKNGWIIIMFMFAMMLVGSTIYGMVDLMNNRHRRAIRALKRQEALLAEAALRRQREEEQAEWEAANQGNLDSDDGESAAEVLERALDRAAFEYFDSSIGLTASAHLRHTEEMSLSMSRSSSMMTLVRHHRHSPLCRRMGSGFGGSGSGSGSGESGSRSGLLLRSGSGLLLDSTSGSSGVSGLSGSGSGSGPISDLTASATDLGALGISSSRGPLESFVSRADRLERSISSSSAISLLSGHRSQVAIRSFHLFESHQPICRKRVPFRDIQFKAMLAQGGTGEVWRATLRGTDVAVKQLVPTKRRILKEMELFMAEIYLLSQLSHPNIVNLVGVAWNTLEHVVMVQDWMQRGDLQQFLKIQRHQQNQENPEIQVDPENVDIQVEYPFHRHGSRGGSLGGGSIGDSIGSGSGSFDQDTGLAFTWQTNKLVVAQSVARALSYLHSLAPQLLHRDVKSKNVLLSDTMDVKLCDFGISRRKHHMDEDGTNLTVTEAAGTMSWTAPEVLLGEDYDEKVDVYSFGILLCEVDTCVLPYHDPQSLASRLIFHPLRLMKQVISQELRPTISKSCPPKIVKLIQACLDRDPEKRPAAWEIVDYLDSEDLV